MPQTNLQYEYVLETIRFCTGIPIATLKKLVPRRSRSIKRWRVRVRKKTRQVIMGLEVTEKLVTNYMKGFIEQKPEKYECTFGK